MAQNQIHLCTMRSVYLSFCQTMQINFYSLVTIAWDAAYTCHILTLRILAFQNWLFSVSLLPLAFASSTSTNLLDTLEKSLSRICAHPLIPFSTLDTILSIIIPVAHPLLDRSPKLSQRNLKLFCRRLLASYVRDAFLSLLSLQMKFYIKRAARRRGSTPLKKSEIASK